MKKICLLLLSIFFYNGSNGQINLIGHTMINNSPIKQVDVTVKVNGVITKTLNTQTKSDFRLQLDFGKVYEIYFRYAKSPEMHMLVIANNIIPEKLDYQMMYELNIPFVFRLDDDVDTTVFKNPFYRVFYNGGKKMVEDTTYNTAFAKTVLKKTFKEIEGNAALDTLKNDPRKKSLPEVATIIAGKVMLNAKSKLIVKNKAISLLNKNGAVMRSTYTNRFGAFVFADVAASQVSAIQMEAKDINSENYLNLVTAKNGSVSSSQLINGACKWILSKELLSKMADNHFTTNIGGKLVWSSTKEKKFYAKKEVYLLNEYNTIIKKTITNLFGTFVFEDIKPDHRYFIGVDPNVVQGARVDLLSKEDDFIAKLDSMAGGKKGLKIISNYNKLFNAVSIDEEEMKMDINATIYGDNINTPIGKLKIILLNDSYEPIDSAITDNFGTFKFKYLPFLKRFYLSAENTENILDVFKDIIIYSNDDNLIKIMTHQKGAKFSYNPVHAEVSRMRDIELVDPWLEFVGEKKPDTVKKSTTSPKKMIVENILFEPGKHAITAQSKEILDKVILVLNSNKNLKIEVGAHTDSQGNAASNLRLSELRANTVKDYISRSGIDVKRIIAKGYGESELLNHCTDDHPCSEMEHAQNRRIEFKILGE
ncbi:OmpA family protein [Aurantibacillus circumpalustris]|uniref:OmpA family protein n=1 Tax=Aurantibacillus circumpalustris TaxID=3036359 RepID=UPI00295C30EF|nr:OmpA family protein [Aurantibacillus circumpalustris]